MTRLTDFASMLASSWAFLASLVMLSASVALWVAYKTKRRIPRLLPLLVTLGLLVRLATLTPQYFAGPVAAIERTKLAPNVTYARIVWTDPHPLTAHVIRVEGEVEWLVTPPDHPEEENVLVARTTSGFAREFDLDVAINGSWFRPWKAGLFFKYPHIGDPVRAEGSHRGRGVGYVAEGADRPRVALEAKGATFGIDLGAAKDASEIIAGSCLLLEHGKRRTEDCSAPRNPTVEPRTAIGGNASGLVVLIVVDGRQPRYSDGATFDELADLFVEQGCTDALNLDGGGSSALVMKQDGDYTPINLPIDARIPGRERPVANHVGFRVRARSDVPTAKAEEKSQ